MDWMDLWNQWWQPQGAEQPEIPVSGPQQGDFVSPYHPLYSAGSVGTPPAMQFLPNVPLDPSQVEDRRGMSLWDQWRAHPQGPRLPRNFPSPFPRQ